MSVVQCPRCGTDHEGAVAEREADAFCRSCDYPLFFAPGPVPAAPESPAADDQAEAEAVTVTAPAALVVPVVGRPCPACFEQNDVAGVFCMRCGHALDADPGPLFDPNPVDFPPPATSSSAAFVLSVLALCVSLLALVVAFVF